jgi:aspartate/methionine/tyrosine aminotransferase
MRIKTSHRLQGIGEYYFSQKLREIEDLNKKGKKVINLGIGSPDMPPHESVIEELQDESNKSNVHSYQNYKGVPPLREAMSAWYKKWYGVNLNAASEILPLIGSKEGIMHISMTYLEKDDEVLIPNPGYPTYRSATMLAGGKVVEYALNAENDWEPDFKSIEQKDLSRVKLMWVNYPHMPTGHLPTTDLFKKIIAFGKRHNILICHDNPYSFILNDHPLSILNIDGAMDCAIELNSLSKSHNMAGWRIGMVCGAADRINEILTFKSNMDSGMFLPLQLAAIKALSLDKGWFNELNYVYQARKDKVISLLKHLGCSFNSKQAGLFIWAKVGQHWKDGYALSDEVLNKARVFITPGGIFGTEGEKYIRVSLCSKEEQLDEALERIHHSLIMLDI